MFKFKSSGIKISDPKFRETIETAESKIRAIGIKTPLEIGDDRTELFKMHIDPLEQIADNLRNLVQTNNGERLGRYAIGCDFKSILFDRNSQNEAEYENLATQNIKKQTQRYIPMVTIDEVRFSPAEKVDYTDKTSLSKVVVNIQFSVPRLKRLKNRIEVILYNGG
jgi:phage baseplate assembly protein W